MFLEFLADAEKMQHLSAVDGGVVVLFDEDDVALDGGPQVGEVHAAHEIERLG